MLAASIFRVLLDFNYLPSDTASYPGRFESSREPYSTSVKTTNQTRHGTKYEMLSITTCYLPIRWLCYICTANPSVHTV